MRIAFTTLGCKINQYETDLLRQDVLAKGNSIVPFDAPADVYVINTCSVTAKSDYQCRQAIRSAVKRGNGAKVIVTGCYASTRPDEVRSIPGVAWVVPNRDKAAIAERIAGDCTTGILSIPESMPAHAIPGRTRSFLKIQDGCDNRCSYCIVPQARGNSRSAAFGGVLSEFRGFVQSGCPEIVLTGIHIGLYGSDLDPRTNLTALLAELLSKRGGSRIRLSSIEANEITDEMLQFLGHGLCRHLHIPLQSGDDSILASMQRRYTSGFYKTLLERIASTVPDIALGADIIVGFPGEGDKEFSNTLRLVQESPLTHLHVFSFSPRRGTPAAEMKFQVPETIKKERSEILREIGMQKNLDFRKRFVGTETEVVLEDKRDLKSNLLTGLTDNYIRVQVKGAKNELIGSKIRAKIEEINESQTIATII